jgi:hypothetical protein
MVFVDFIVLNQMVKGFLRVDYLVATQQIQEKMAKNQG